MNARALGLKVIGVTSVAYATATTSRHASGTFLKDHCDIVLDSKIAVGDAELTAEGIEAPFAPASTVVTSALMQAVVAAAAGELAARGIEPPLLRSGNVDGGHEWNGRVMTRVRRTGSSTATERPVRSPAATARSTRRCARSSAAAIRARDVLRVRRVRAVEGAAAGAAQERDDAQRPAAAAQHRAQPVHRALRPLAGRRPTARRPSPAARLAGAAPAPHARAHRTAALDRLERRVALRVADRDAARDDRRARARRARRRGGRRPDQTGPGAGGDASVRRRPAASGLRRCSARSISAWSAKPASAKSRWTVAASIGSSHSAAARAARCSWLSRKRSRGRLLLGQLGLRDVLEEPAHPQRHRLLGQRRGQPQEAAAPAPRPPPSPGSPRRLAAASPTARRAPGARPPPARAGARPPAPPRPGRAVRPAAARAAPYAPTRSARAA